MKSDDFLKKYKNLRNREIEEKINKYGWANDRAEVTDGGIKIDERIIKK
jgi:hypothetical protein